MYPETKLETIYIPFKDQISVEKSPFWENVAKIEIKFGSVTNVTLELFLYLYLCSVNMGGMILVRPDFTKIQH